MEGKPIPRPTPQQPGEPTAAHSLGTNVSSPISIPRGPRSYQDDPRSLQDVPQRRFEVSPAIPRSISKQLEMAGSPESEVAGGSRSNLDLDLELSGSLKSDLTLGSRSQKPDASSLAAASAVTSNSSRSTAEGQGQPKVIKAKPPEPHKIKRVRTDTERSTFSAIFDGGFARLQSQLSHTGSVRSSLALSRPHINVVMDAASVDPCYMSTFSIEKLVPPSLPSSWAPHKPHYPLKHLQDSEMMSSSMQDHLERPPDLLEQLENPDYTDTVQSTDSAASLLRRSLSIPPNYEYKPHKLKTKHATAREVFKDFVPQDEEGGRKWRQTMEDLLERPEYEDSLTKDEALELAKHALQIRKEYAAIREEDEYGDVEIGEMTYDPKEHLKYLKNLIVLSISFLLVFTSYLSLRNLQSSLNAGGGLGLIALSTVYASLFCGCIFATTIVQRLRPKPTMLLCGIGFLIYTVANFYPHYYTLVPASCIAGFSLANIWTAHATYLTNIAARYAEHQGKILMNVISQFNGLFYMFFQTSQIWGGIISSTVLVATSPSLSLINGLNYTDIHNTTQDLHNFTFHLNMTTPPRDLVTNLSTCGSAFCHSSQSASSGPDVPESRIYTLVGIYTACLVTGVLLLLIFLDPLEGSMQRSTATVGTQLLAVFRFFGSKQVVCLVGLMFYSLLQNSFMFGEFTKAFVTCPVGVHMVGYTMLCLSAASAVSSFVNGKLIKYTGRLPLFAIGAVIHLSLLLVMLLWQPNGELPVNFTIAGLWGIGDGIFITQTTSLMAVLFPKKREPAFAALKMCQSLGACLLFVTAPLFCMRVKIGVMMTVLTVAMSLYLLLEIRMKMMPKKEKKLVLKGPTTV